MTEELRLWLLLVFGVVAALQLSKALDRWAMNLNYQAMNASRKDG